ncbi:MAG: HPr-rel-A system PqqD family peptide chaperone [Steroidobacteraceae bacterium]
MCWRAESAQCLWTDWDDLAVLYHRPSGKTHFINAPTAFLLEQFSAAPSTLDAVARALAEAQGRAIDDELREGVAGMAQRLEELGLIERV